MGGKIPSRGEIPELSFINLAEAVLNQISQLLMSDFLEDIPFLEQPQPFANDLAGGMVHARVHLFLNVAGQFLKAI